MQRVVLIDYGSGNLHSAAKAFERAAREGGIGAEIVVSADAEVVRTADRIVLPGVGAFADCKRGLEALPGMRAALEEAVIGRRRPFLGICVGMQLMASRGLEFEVTDGLGWIKGEVRAIEPAEKALKIPHMGWNTLDVPGSKGDGAAASGVAKGVPDAGVRGGTTHPLLDGIALGEHGLHAYFVHSFQLVPRDLGVILATTDYGGPVTAMIAQGNLAGTQFHPEKSQRLGLALIANFLAWRP